MFSNIISIYFSKAPQSNIIMLYTFQGSEAFPLKEKMIAAKWDGSNRIIFR